MKISCPKCNGQMQMPESFTAGKYTCPLCNSPFMCDASGMTYLPTPSPNSSQTGVRKGGLILPKRHKMTYAEMKRKVQQQQFSNESDSASNGPGGNGALCFWMGALFWVLGLVIAAIVGKGNGVKKALLGMLISSVLYFVVLVFLIVKFDLPL